MRKEGLFITVLLLVTFLIGCTKEIAPPENSGIQTTQFATKSSSGQVAIDLTPYPVRDGTLEMDISVNTHTGNLADYDLLQLVTLTYDGNSVKPREAPKMSGHHSRGKLVFLVDEEVTQFVVIIRGIPDIEERTFEWP